MMSFLSNCFPYFSRHIRSHREEDQQYELTERREVEALRAALYTQLFGNNPDTSSRENNELLLQELRTLFRNAAIVRSGGVPEGFILNHLSNVSFRASETTPGLENEQDGRHCCIICQDCFIDGQSITSLDCNHNFHFACLKKWLVENNNCPICREKAVKAEIDVCNSLSDILAPHRRALTCIL